MGYQYKRTIAIIGESEKLQTTLQSFPVISETIHYTFETISADAVQVSDVDVLIVETSTDMIDYNLLMSTLMERKKERAIVILYSEVETIEPHFQKWLLQLTDVWKKPATIPMVQFQFQKLQKYLLMEANLWMTTNYFETTINSVPDLIWYKDKVGAHLKVNDAFCKTVEKTKEQVEGRGHFYIWDMPEEEYEKGEYICLESETVVMEKGETCVFDEMVKTKKGMKQFLTYKSPLFDEDKRIIGTVGVAHDVTMERSYQKQLVESANTDFLTKLYNRRYCYEYMEEHAYAPLTMFYMDLDDFKAVNDQFGHNEGDLVLIRTAEVIRKMLPDSMASRVGGDEFIMIVTGEQPLEKMEEWAEKLIVELEKVYQSYKSSEHVAASIGISQTDGTKDMDQLIKESDDAMYSSKNEKKDARKYKSIIM